MQSRTTHKTQRNQGELLPDTDLGLAILVAEDEEGAYQPVAVASTINEARELAASDFAARRRRLQKGDEPGLCPARYQLWVQGFSGAYETRIEIAAP